MFIFKVSFHAQLRFGLKHFQCKGRRVSSPPPLRIQGQWAELINRRGLKLSGVQDMHLGLHLEGREVSYKESVP